MVKILKNTTVSDIEIKTFGQTIPASSQINIDCIDYLLLGSADVITELTTGINSGDVVVNDGTSDLSAGNALAFLEIYPYVFGSTANTVAEGNHVHPDDSDAHQFTSTSFGAINIRDIIIQRGSGQVQQATPALPPIGYAASSVADAQPIVVITEGILGGFTGLVPANVYWLNPATPGAITNVKPTTGSVAYMVGIARTATEMHIEFRHEVLPKYKEWVTRTDGLINQQNAVYETFLTNNFVVPETGIYNITFNYLFSQDTTHNNFECHLNINGTFRYPVHIEPQDSAGAGIDLPVIIGGVEGPGTANTGTDQRIPAAGSVLHSLNAGSNTILLEFATRGTQNVDATIYEATIVVEQM